MKPQPNNKPLIPLGWLRALLFVAFYLVLLVVAGLLVSYFQIKSTPAAKPAAVPAEPGVAPAGMFYLLFIINAIVSFAAVWLFRTFVDRRSFTSMGFAFDKNGAHAGTGFFLGIFLLCAGSCILFFTKNLAWTDIQFDGNDLFISFGLMVIVAFYEEIVFRGYILNNLLSSLNQWIALAVSALVFALAHITNPGIGVAGAVNILLAGILLGLNYMYTRNLWFSIKLHFSWNFFQGPILGYEVSGMPLKSLLRHQLAGSELLTGGTFGFEGSIVATILYLLAIGGLLWVYQKKYAAQNISASDHPQTALTETR